MRKKEPRLAQTAILQAHHPVHAFGNHRVMRRHQQTGRQLAVQIEHQCQYLLGITAGGIIGTIIMATIGAAILLFIVGLIKK